jgi:hypothetical protein
VPTPGCLTGLMRLAGDDVEVMTTATRAQVEQVLALAEIARSAALPAADVGRRMLDLDPLTQPTPPGRGLSPGGQLAPMPPRPPTSSFPGQKLLPASGRGAPR